MTGVDETVAVTVTTTTTTTTLSSPPVTTTTTTTALMDLPLSTLLHEDSLENLEDAEPTAVPNCNATTTTTTTTATVITAPEDDDDDDNVDVDNIDNDDKDFLTSLRENDEYDLNLPPGRIKAIRNPRNNIHLPIPPGLPTILRKQVERAGSVSSSNRSRSRSPFSKDRSHDGNSSMSSLEDFVDSDILYDRAGFSELELLDNTAPASHSQRKLREFSNLPPVNERMTEDTLEDVHAFSDVKSSNASRTGNSIATGNEAFLEPLNEEDDEDDLDHITEEDEDQHPQVILTNLDNLAIDSFNDRNGAHAREIRGTAESSLMEEAPSAPSA